MAFQYCPRYGHSAFDWLLRIRYGESLRIDISATPAHSLAALPPLSLQLLIDNAIKHNVMTPARPLAITITVVGKTEIRVINTLQRKSRILDTTPRRLANLKATYQQLSTQPVQIETDDKLFSVTLPLLSGMMASAPMRPT